MLKLTLCNEKKCSGGRMATKRAKGYIALEILGIVLAVLLYIILTQPPKIWKVESQKRNTCRLHMRSLYEAEQYYYKRNNQFTKNIDTLVQFIAEDSVVQNNRKIVEYSRLLYNQIDDFYNVPLVNAFYRIHSAINTIQGDYIQNETYLESQDSLILQAKVQFENIMKKLNSLYDPYQFKQASKILIYLNKIDSVYKNINDLKLQIASQMVMVDADSVYRNAEKGEFTDFLNKLNEIQTEIYDLIGLMKQTKLARITNLPDRLKKFTDQMRRASQEIPLMNLGEQSNLVQDIASKFKALHDDFITPEKFNLTSNYASLSLSEEDSLLIKLAPDFAKCPDSGEDYIIKFFGSKQNAILIECPNLQNMARELVLPEIEKLNALDVRKAWNILQKANDSLYVVLNKAIIPYRKTRKARDIIFVKKDAENMLNLFYENTPLSFKFSKKLDIMVDTLKNDFRISLLKTQLEENLNGMDTLAVRCETGNFEVIDNWMAKVVKSTMVLDSTLKANMKLLRRRDRKSVVDLMPVIEYWKSMVQNYESKFTAEQAPILKEVRNNLSEIWEQKVQKGKKEVVKVIFKETHKNHGYINNGQLSWE